MELLRIPIGVPVEYIKSGLFTAELGWLHHKMMHGADTELLIGLSGAVHLKIGQNSYTLSRGDILTVFPFETIIGSIPTTTESEFIWVHFVQPEPAIPINSPRLLDSTTDYSYLPRFIHLSLFSQTIVNAQQLLDITHDPLSFIQTKNYQTSLVILTISNEIYRQSNNSDHKGTSINKVKEWIRVNMSRKPSVLDIAEHFYLNPDYLNRLFKRETGKSITTYIKNLKIEYAKLLLLSTNESIQNISAQAFFNDSKYFTRVFSTSTSLSPSQYRKTYTHTFLNNNQVDPGVDLHNKVRHLEKLKDQN